MILYARPFLTMFVNRPSEGHVDSVFTRATHFFGFGFLAGACAPATWTLDISQTNSRPNPNPAALLRLAWPSTGPIAIACFVERASRVVGIFFQAGIAPCIRDRTLTSETRPEDLQADYRSSRL